MTTNEGPWPVEIRVKRAARQLEIDFDDGARFVYPAEYLRVESPSARLCWTSFSDEDDAKESELSSFTLTSICFRS